MFWATWHQNMSTYTPGRFSSSTWKRSGVLINANYSVSQKITHAVFWFFFRKLLRILIKISHAYYTFIFTLNYKILFSYLQLSFNISQIGSCICRVDWHNNGWPWVTLNDRFRIARYLCGSWASCLKELRAYTVNCIAYTYSVLHEKHR